MKEEEYVLEFFGVANEPDEGVWWINSWFAEDWEGVEISNYKFWLRCSVGWRVREPDWDEIIRTSSFVRGSWDDVEEEELRKGEGGWTSTTNKIHQEIWKRKGERNKKILLMMRSKERIQGITQIRPRKAWTTNTRGRKLTWRRCIVTTVKELTIMLMTVEERRKHEQKITMKHSMHVLEILILMMCYSWPTLSRTQRKPTLILALKGGLLAWEIQNKNSWTSFLIYRKNSNFAQTSLVVVLTSTSTPAMHGTN